MQHKTFALAAAMAMVSAWAHAQPRSTAPQVASAVTRVLTLREALRLAQDSNPALRARQSQAIAAEGLAMDAAAALSSNPELSLERTRRRVPSDGATERRNEWSAALSQTFEIAGQPAYRRRAADAALAAGRLEIEDASARVRADATERYFRVLAWQQRSELETQALALLEDTAQAVQRRRAAGEDTRLDANFASVETERARNQLAAVEEQLIEARGALAAALQLPVAELPRATGELTPAPLPYDLGALLRSASSQPRLQALAAREQSAAARVLLERAGRYPDVTVGVGVGREGPVDARERLTTVTISLPLPLFQRNAAGIGQANAELSQAQVERRAAERDTASEVQALWARLQSLRKRIERLQRSVLPALADNERLAGRSRQAGQIGLLELIVVNRQALDARRDLIEASLAYQTTRAALEAAAGWSGQP